jgi:hypothetical protein
LLKQSHIAVTTQALKGLVSQRALGAILRANIAQDNLRGQIGHPEYHFDNNAFEAGRAYIEEQRRTILKVHAEGAEINPAWEAFGRLTHAVQDFYAHSNYLALWMQRQRVDPPPPPAEVEALDRDLLNHPELRSGYVHMVEVLSFILPLLPVLRRILPPNSHAYMNLLLLA